MTGSLVYIGISSVVCYPIVYLILRLFKIDSLSAVLICLLFLSEALYSLLGQIVRGLGYNAKYSVSVVVYSAVNLAATAVMLMGFHLGLQGVIISLTIGYLSSDLYMVLVSGMLAYFKLDEFSRKALKELLDFSMPIDLNKVIEIKYNKREIVIGMSCFLVAAVCLNQSNMLTIATCFLFAIVYNITQNIQIIKKIVRKFLKK